MKNNLFLSTLFVLAMFAGNSATIYVNSATGSDANAGSVGAPYKTFHKAYTMANSGDVIDLTGTFDWTATDETGDAATSGYTISKNLTIQGQGASSTIVQAYSVRNSSDRRVFTISGGFAITIKNLKIRHGNVGANQSGGGLLLSSSSQIINLENLVIEKNDVNSSGYNFGGGGIAIFNSNSSADINITNTEISNNATSAWGGGIYTSGSSGSSSNKTIVFNSTFSNNTASGAGAIAAYYGRNFVLINSTISGNTGSEAVSFSNHNTGSVFFLNNTIAYNTVLYNSAYLEFVSSATLQNNIIAENRNSSNVLQGYITQRNVVPSYYNNVIDLIPTNWAASNDVLNGVNGNVVGTNLTLGLSNTLGLNSSTSFTKTLAISCVSVATNAGSSSSYGYLVPPSDQRGFARNGTTDIGAFENSGGSEISTSGTITAFTKCGSSSSSNKTINVLGCNLTNNITISAPIGFEISTNSSSGFSSSLVLNQTSGSVASTIVYIRMTAASTGSNSGDLEFSSTGASPITITISGVASQSPAITGNDYLYLGHTGNYTSTETAAATNPWVISNTSFATTTTSGVVTAVAAGAPILTFTSSSGCSSTKTINVVAVEWVGTTSTDWTIGSNWNGGYVPTNYVSLSVKANATSDLVLDGSKTVTTLTFNGASRKVVLGSFNLTATTINGANASNYVKTSGTGQLKQTLANNVSKVYPIGNSAYNPLTITNKSGASDVFLARVVDGAFMEGLTGAAITSTVLNRTWDISKTNANAGSGVDFVFNWNAGEVANGSFVTPKMNHYSSSTSNWEVPTVTSTVFGSNMLTVTGYTGTFSPFTIAEGSSPLPVELTSFNANCSENATTINWQTASEHNSAYFDIEKSRDGATWNVIKTVNAAGNSTSTIDYSTIDSEKAMDVVYYRLNQVDIDGASKIYGPISVSCDETNDFTATIFPNPTAKDFSVSFLNSEAQNFDIQLIGTDGKVVYQTTRLVEAGASILPLSSEYLNAGVYSLHVKGENTLKTIKLVVQ